VRVVLSSAARAAARPAQRGQSEAHDGDADGGEAARSLGHALADSMERGVDLHAMGEQACQLRLDLAAASCSDWVTEGASLSRCNASLGSGGALTARKLTANLTASVVDERGRAWTANARCLGAGVLRMDAGSRPWTTIPRASKLSVGRR
jgi:hypothetical protein